MEQIINSFYEQLTLLCVEDDPITLEMYQLLFESIFKKVYFAKDGVEGFELFKNHEIDLIITDYQMPNANGLQMSKKIRKIDPTIPIVLVTGLESLEMLQESIELHITSYLKKPFDTDKLFESFELAVKSIIADRYLLKQQSKQLEYSQYQENLTFIKEKQITKNEINEYLFDYRCEVIYQPLDTLSGDSYLIKKIDDENYFLFLVDGMGKGIPASVTAMMSSAFINYSIDTLKKENKPFAFQTLLNHFHEFIMPNLLDDETLCATFLHLQSTTQTIEYAIFSMPPMLYMDTQKNVCKIKSNNPPMGAYTIPLHFNTISFENITKLLIYTDGLNEAILKESTQDYTTHVIEDFTQTNNAHELFLEQKKKVQRQEDDITFIFLNKNEMV